MQEKTYDLIVAGLGAAGLTLVRKLLESSTLAGMSVLLIDSSVKPFGDKTWCFWDEVDSDLTGYSDHIWSVLDVQAKGERFSERLKRLRYHCVRSETYSQKIIETIHAHPSIDILEADILGYSLDVYQRYGVVSTSKGDHKGRWVFQSALRPAPLTTDPTTEIKLVQHFEGWEIETKDARFDPDRAMLMDFDTPQADGVTFFYILPFTERKALIEYTIFSENLLSDQEYERGVITYLSSLGLEAGSYTVNRRERGAIPMDTTRYPAWWNNRVMNIGSVAGHTKPSTGYTFMRIQKQCEQIVSDLEKRKKPSHSGLSSYRFRVYDRMLLHILKHDPPMAVKIFHSLFKRNSISRVLRFLDEKTVLVQELSIFSTLPYIPFFKAIGAQFKRIVQGA